MLRFRRTKSASTTVLPLFSLKRRFQKAINVINTVRNITDLVRNNLFINAMHYLCIVLNLGYYTFLIPFRVTADESLGEFKLITNYAQKIVCYFILVSSILLEITVAKTSWPEEGIKENARKFFETAERTMTITLMITYLYTCIKSSRFLKIFDVGKNIHKSQNRSYKTYGEIRCILMTWIFLIFLAFANWSSWGNKYITVGRAGVIGTYYNLISWMVGLPNGWENYSIIYYAVAIIHAILEFHKEFLKLYIEFLMLGTALSMYKVEGTLRRYLLKDNSNFEIRKAIESYRIVKKLIKNLSLAMGPITVAYYLQLIPYGVCTAMISRYTDGNFYDYYFLLIVAIKLTHIIVTAETCANGNNLKNEINSDKIPYRTDRILDIGLILELKSVMEAPIALFGMDFFQVSYPLLAQVGLHVVTYCFLVVELSQSSSSPEETETPKCPSSNMN